MAGVCCIQGAKRLKCNGLHLVEHHCHFMWCYKASDKINPPRLETKKGIPCPHLFKCINCKGDHQADLATVLSGNTASTRSGSQKNMPNSRKPGTTQFIHLWMVTTYDFRKSQNLFAKCLKKQFYHQNDPWGSFWFWHHFHPGTLLVIHLFHSLLWQSWSQSLNRHRQSPQLAHVYKRACLIQWFTLSGHLCQH